MTVIGILHLLVFIPLSVSFGFVLAAVLAANNNTGDGK